MKKPCVYTRNRFFKILVHLQVVKNENAVSWVRYYVPNKANGLWSDGDIEYQLLLDDVVRILKPPIYVPHRRRIEYKFPDFVR